MNPIKLLNEHCEFNTEYDVYVLLAISRKKDTPEITNSQEIVFREVIRHKDDIVRKYNKLKAQAENYIDDNGKKFPFYIYVSLNARNTKIAFFNYQQLLLSWTQELANGNQDVVSKIKRADRHYISLLMKPECRSKNRYFMIDFDSKNPFDVEQINKFFEINNLKEELIQETKNGYHIKVKPFDRRLVESDLCKALDMEIKTDANFFVEYILIK